MLKRFCFFLLLSLICFSGFAQKWPSTLLWRISGNGLTAPSYLFGTMHLQDKRLFHFSDSVYGAIEKVSGLAIEVNFKDFMDTVLARQIRTELDELKQQVQHKSAAVDRRSLPPSADTLLRRLNLQKDSISHTDLRTIRNYRVQEVVREDMPTIVDGFLYGLAQRQGKWTGGIEDVEDQLDVLDEMGNELTTEKAFMQADSLRRQLNALVKAYEAQDLQKISELLQSGNNELADPDLVRRNGKMARRMDSLAALRTMFFAVGAAHLPGDSGVIAKLRRRGFTVEPVFAPRRTDATVYAQRLASTGWTRVDGEENIYSVEMPGRPSDFDLLGQAVRMKMYFDLTSMTVFMIGQSLGQAGNDAGTRTLFLHMAEQMGALSPKSIVPRPVQQGGAKGLEGSFSTRDGAYRLRLMQRNRILYMQLLGSSRKESLVSSDAARFFSSFVARDAAVRTDRIVFALPEKYVRFPLPGQPRPNPDFNSMAAGSPWIFDTYDYVDNASGIYYIVQVRDLKAHYNFLGESSYFNMYETEFGNRGCKTVLAESGHYQGFPSFRFDAVLEKENAQYKTFMIVRGRRIYVLMAIGNRTTDMSGVASLFNSVVIDNYPPAPLAADEVNGFSTELPLSARYKMGRTGDALIFDAFDSVQNAAYLVSKRTVPALYWCLNDTFFFDQQIKLSTYDWGEPISKTYTSNGSVRGVETLSEASAGGNLKRTRILISGDTIYTLSAIFPGPEKDRPEYSRFFSEFRVSNERPASVFQSHCDELIEALLSPDSATVARARTIAISLVPDPRNADCYHRMLLHEYRDDAAPLTVAASAALGLTADTTLFSFIAEEYPKAKSERIRANLLEALATIPKRRAYELLAHLLETDRPAFVTPFTFQQLIIKSTELAGIIEPQLVKLFNDSTYGPAAASVSWILLQHQQLDTSLLLANAPGLNAAVRKALANGDLLQQHALIPLLFLVPGTEAEKNLADVADHGYPIQRAPALLELLRRGATVSNDLVGKLAQDPQTRLELYSGLKDMGRTTLFPMAYATTSLLAESKIHTIVLNEYEDSATISYIGERTTLYKGRMQKFLLYKIGLHGTPEYSLGVVGAYDLKPTVPLALPTISGLYDEEYYSPTAIDAQLKRFLEEKK